MLYLTRRPKNKSKWRFCKHKRSKHLRKYWYNRSQIVQQVQEEEAYQDTYQHQLTPTEAQLIEKRCTQYLYNSKRASHQIQRVQRFQKRKKRREENLYSLSQMTQAREKDQNNNTPTQLATAHPMDTISNQIIPQSLVPTRRIFIMNQQLSTTKWAESQPIASTSNHDGVGR